MKTQIMLDLETLGQRPGSVILSIGACVFDPSGVKEKFYTRVDAQSCIDCGLQTDVSTFLWWMKQGDEARHELLKPGKSLRDALIDFSLWLDNRDCEIWGNGSDFDNALLKAAFEAANVPVPWKFWGNRCYRTVKNLHPEIMMTRSSGVAHNALDDAVAQAGHLIAILWPTAHA